MQLKSLLPIAMLIVLAAGCHHETASTSFHSRDVGRPDAAWGMEKSFRGFPAPVMASRGLVARDPLEAQRPANLNFHRAPAHQVIAAMTARFNCRITLTQKASNYIHTRDVRITARAAAIPANLAFEVLRGQLETAGLVVQEAPNSAILGRAHFLVDRSRLREATVPSSL
jgi:hypothetical protein